jgi:hypothetical protein
MILLKREITVYIDDKGAPREIKESAVRAVRDAAINWEDALQREIKFRFVPFRDADVVISYTDGVRYDGKEAAGLVRWTRQVMNLGSGQYRYEVRANITLRTNAPNGATMNYRQMLHTAGHELGHVLGLEDSARQGDLMGPLVLNKPTERATKAERDSLIEFRLRAGEILAKIYGNEPQDFEPFDAEVVSEPAEQLETEKPTIRDDRDERRPALVRSSRRDKQAKQRKAGFTITGMAGR